MSERHDTSSNHDDPALGAALRGLGQWAEGAATLPGADRARGIARRRRVAQISGAGVVALALVVTAVINPFDGGPADIVQTRPVPVAAPTTTATPEPSESATPDPTVTETAPETTPPAPTITAPPPTTPETPKATAPALSTPDAEIPADFDLGQDREPGPLATITTVDDPDIDICSGGGLPGLGDAADTAFVRESGPEYGRTDGLLVFDDAAGAARFVAGLSAEATRCSDPVPEGENGRQVLQTPIGGPWAEGVALLRVDDVSVPDSTGEAYPDLGSWALVGRIGSAVRVTDLSSEWLLTTTPTTVDPVALDEIRPDFDAGAAALCRWTAAGC